jgi:hypothetical protein
MDGKRWYHRFSAITAKAGGFDLARDVLTGHGPLGVLYPTNTTHWQKEGDTMTFLYLVPTGMNDPEQPTWGSWAGRYGAMTNDARFHYFWASQFDSWNRSTNRDNTLARWAAHLQNDFRARLDWCVKDFAHANHPPLVQLPDSIPRQIISGQRISLDATRSKDPDGNALSFEWIHYAEPGTARDTSVAIENARTARATLIAPTVHKPTTVHIIVAATDNGTPPLTRYGRLLFTVLPRPE